VKATGARLVRQRSTSWEHSSVRQYGFLSDCRATRWAISRTKWLSRSEKLCPLLPICLACGSTRCTGSYHRRRLSRHGLEREPDLRRAGRGRLQRPFRLHLLLAAVRIQPPRRCCAICLRQRNVRSTRGAGALDRPLPGSIVKRFYPVDAAFDNTHIRGLSASATRSGSPNQYLATTGHPGECRSNTLSTIPSPRTASMAQFSPKLPDLTNLPSWKLL
jgi:hypothetical protein